MINKKKSLLVQIVSDFLEHYFKPWNLKGFSDEHAILLFKTLLEQLSKEEIIMFQEEIPIAIKNFFNNFGKINIEIVLFQSLSIKTEIRDSAIATFKLLHKHQKHFEILKDSNLIIINEKVTKHILDTVKSDYDVFREDIRATLSHVIDLGPNYAILFGRSRITVRIQLKESSSEKRYMGLPSEELESIIERHFPDLDNEIPELMLASIQKDFNFLTLSNEKFESDHIKLLQRGLIKVLKQRSKQDDEVIKALANFILRKQFDNLHMMIAKQLMEAIMSKNPKAEKFLNYYTQGVVSHNGMKYKIPSLEDTEGKVWSFANLSNIFSQYQKFIQGLNKKEAQIDHMAATLDTIDSDIINAQKTVKTVEFAIADNTSKLRKTAQNIKSIRSTFQSKRDQLSSEQKISLEQQAKELEKEERDFMVAQKQHEQAHGLSQKAFSDLKYKKQTTIERYNSEIDNLEHIQDSHKEIQEKYELVLTAIVKALTGKKSKI